MLIPILAFGVAALGCRYLQAYAPSNAIVARVRQERPCVRVAAGLVGLSVTHAVGALVLAEWVENGGPGWLNLGVLIAIWDAFKLGFLALAVMVRRALLALPHGTGQHIRLVAS
jgi:hypothetical protein